MAFFIHSFGHRIRRLRFLVLGTALLGGQPSLHAQDLGANFNENIDVPIEHIDQLVDSRVAWIRGFVNIPRFFLEFDADGRISGVKETTIRNFENTRKFVDVRRASAGGIELIMSLKIPFEEIASGVPAPGTREMDYLLEAIELFLISHDLGKNIGILVLGNEPMWENGEQAEAYGLFLNLLADTVADWKIEHDWDFMVFAGSLNRISEMNHADIPVVMNAVNTNENIDGLDLHIHAANLNQTADDLRVARVDYGVTKKIICTEFSMVRAFTSARLNQTIGEWGTANGYSPDLKVYEWLNLVTRKAAEGNPIPPGEFVDFFHRYEWYPKHWYQDFYDAFEEYDTYAITGRFVAGVGERNYSADTSLWALGALYSGVFMGRDPETGLVNESPLLYPEFEVIADELYGTDPADPIVNVASMEQALTVNWAGAPATGGWGVSSAGFSGFTLTSLINGEEAGELSYAGGDQVTLGVGGAGSFGFARTVNTSADGEIVEALRLDLPPRDGQLGPDTALRFRGLASMQFSSLLGGANPGNAVSIHGFVGDPEAHFLMGGGELSFDAESGTLWIGNPTADAAIVGFSNPEATTSESGVSLTLTNRTATDRGHGFGLTQWSYEVVRDAAVFMFLEEPEDLTVWEETAAIFRAEVLNGSDIDLSYRWEVSGDGGSSWTIIPGAESPSYSIENVTRDLDRRRYRVVVTRERRESLFSEPALLRVREGTLAPPKGVVAHYRFEEGKPGEPASGAVDSGGMGYGLTATVGEPVFAANVPASRLPATGQTNAGSLDLTAGQSSIDGVDGEGLSLVEFTDFTIEVWVKFHGLSGFQTIIGRDDRGDLNHHGQGLFRLEKVGTTDLFRVVAWQSDAQDQFFTSDYRLAAGEWTHLAVVGNTQDGTVSLYANGERVGFHEAGFSGLRVPPTGTAWTLGRGQWMGEPADFLDGMIDEVRFTAAALRPDQFLNAAPPKPRLLEDWRLAHFGSMMNTGEAANLADFDGDEIQNLLEYALGTDPRAPGAGRSPLDLALNGSSLTLSFSHIADPALTYEIEAADALDAEWNAVAIYAFNEAGTEVYEDEAPMAGHSRRFLRLKVSTPAR